jgi:hypothetical protein
MRVSLLLVLLCAPRLQAQTLSFGAKGGGFFTEPAGRADQSRKYAIGPMFELGLGSRVGLEIDALYSRFGASLAGVSVRGHSVEFPVLGKYYFSSRGSAVRPYAASGFAFRNIWFDDGRFGRFGSRFLNSTDPAVGAVVSGGVAFKASIFTFAPEVRYTRWGGYTYPATNPNQVQALLGVTF